MLSITVLTGFAACLSTLANAQLYQNRSEPFNLVLESATNKTLNGSRLVACHSGAAIESLCLYPSAANSESATFYYNFTTQTTPTSGIITWNLPLNGGSGVSEPISFQYDPTTNIALPLFYPSESNEIQFTFDKNHHLNVLAYLDDTVKPPTFKQYQLSRWQICQTYYGSYSYTTLAWVLGKGKPQNPSCQAVKVRRQAIPKS